MLSKCIRSVLEMFSLYDIIYIVNKNNIQNTKKTQKDYSHDYEMTKSEDGSKVKVVTLTTNEELVIAQDTMNLVNNK